MAAAASETSPPSSLSGRERLVWLGLFLLGPTWGAYDWVRIHPFELSYYNIGLANAVDAGFETTYWYDAVTPGVLHELNEKFPPNVVIGFPDPMINPDTFAVLQDMGRLRSDVRSHEPGRQKLPWFWLLSHSSKATAFTRLLYAVPPWYESGHDGVRLFSVVDDEAAAVAWTLHALVVERDPKSAGGPVLLREGIISMDPAELKHAMQRLTQLVDKSPSEVAAAMMDWPVADQQLVAPWLVGGAIDANLASMLRLYPDAVQRAIDILATRKDDVRAILAYPGYMRPESFGGYLYERTTAAENPHE
jgi:hypothetical protein